MSNDMLSREEIDALVAGANYDPPCRYEIPPENETEFQKAVRLLRDESVERLEIKIKKIVEAEAEIVAYETLRLFKEYKDKGKL